MNRNNKKFKNFTNKIRYKNRRRKYKNRNRNRNFNYQYRPSMQSMGPGTTVKNFEKRNIVNSLAEVKFDISSFANDPDLDSSFRSYRYFKVVAIGITQNNMNLPNEQDNCYVRVAWSNNYEETQDIKKDDATKILPNIGRKLFMFKPPNVQLPIYRNGQVICLNLKHYEPTELALNSVTDAYQIPGSIHVYNDTSSGRYITFILRIRFRGSKVLNAEAESRRILTKLGYKVIKEEGLTKVQEEDEKEEIGQNEEEEDEDEEEESKWNGGVDDVD